MEELSPSSQTQGEEHCQQGDEGDCGSGLGGPGDLGVEFEFVSELIHDVGLLLGVSISMPVVRNLAPVVGRLSARCPVGFLPALSLPQPPGLPFVFLGVFAWLVSASSVSR